MTSIADSERRRRSRRAGQDGFVLMIVLGLLLAFSVIGLAIAGLTVAGDRIATGLAGQTATIREADSALESAVNQVRKDPAAQNAGSDCASISFQPLDSTQFPDVGTMVCYDNAPAADTRDMTVSVCTVSLPNCGTSGSNIRPFAQARIVVTDAVGTGIAKTRKPGYAIDVCDWQVASQISSNLNTC
jgi:Tfp pilus assembly protein PilX